MALHSSRFIPLFRRGAVVSTLSVFVILLLFPFKTVVFVILVHSISQSLIYKRLTEVNIFHKPGGLYTQCDRYESFVIHASSYKMERLIIPLNVGDILKILPVGIRYIALRGNISSRKYGMSSAGISVILFLQFALV